MIPLFALLLMPKASRNCVATLRSVWVNTAQIPRMDADPNFPTTTEIGQWVTDRLVSNNVPLTRSGATPYGNGIEGSSNTRATPFAALEPVISYLKINDSIYVVVARMVCSEPVVHPTRKGVVTATLWEDPGNIEYLQVSDLRTELKKSIQQMANHFTDEFSATHYPSDPGLDRYFSVTRSGKGKAYKR